MRAIVVYSLGLWLAAVAATRSFAEAFVVISRRPTPRLVRSMRQPPPPHSSLSSSPHRTTVPEADIVVQERRRALLQTAWTAATTAAWVAWSIPAHADTGAEVRGTPVNAFNGLTFQYRGNDFDGLRATDLNEPSIPYLEFCHELKLGNVALVEFYAPNGDVAYATLRTTEAAAATGEASPGRRRVRIGEGYPIERHDGYSSPAFAIRTVQ